MEDTDETASESYQGQLCLLRPFWQATTVQNFRTFISARIFISGLAKA